MDRLGSPDSCYTLNKVKTECSEQTGIFRQSLHSGLNILDRLEFLESCYILDEVKPEYSGQTGVSRQSLHSGRGKD